MRFGQRMSISAPKDVQKNFTLIKVYGLCPSLKGEMIDKLTLTYNRTRQAVITRGLIEIISGAAALHQIENFLLK